MRFMMLMIPAVYQGEAGAALKEKFFPDAEEVDKMMRFNEELAKAGALVALDGLHPPSLGARIAFTGGRPIVTDGPYTELKEVLGGYWVIQASSRAEAIEWAKRAPARNGDVIEVRQVFEVSDFPPDVRAAAESSAVTEQLEKVSRL